MVHPTTIVARAVLSLVLLGLAPAQPAHPAAPLIPDASASTPALAAPIAQESSATTVGRLIFRAGGLNRVINRYGCAWRVLPRGIYQWPCDLNRSGLKNHFIIGHAYDSMRSLTVAYAHHRLRVGQTATLITQGTIVRYKVAWIRLIPANGGSPTWAWGETSGPTITLWTCYGSRSQSRLIVRFVRG